MDWFIAILDRSDLSVVSSYVNGTTYDDQVCERFAPRCLVSMDNGKC